MQGAQRIVICGATGNALDVLETVNALARVHGVGAFECIGFLDDDPGLAGRTVAGVPVLGGFGAAPTVKGAVFVSAVGSPDSYRRKSEILAKTGVGDERFTTLIHPLSDVAKSATLGPDTVILSHVSVGAQARIGKHVLVLQQTVIGHDAVVGDFSTIAAGVRLSGRVKVGRQCYLGSGAAVIQDATIGDGTLVGMGSVVLESVKNDLVVAGNPARILRPA